MSKISVLDRFEALYCPEPNTGCWIWIGHANGKPTHQYGYFRDGNKICKAARWSYQYFKGPIPEGLTVDHICRMTLCVNPAHLRVMTLKENILLGTGPAANNKRKEFCKYGHNDWETKKVKGGKTRRDCKVCRMRHWRAWNKKQSLRRKQNAAIK